MLGKKSIKTLINSTSSKPITQNKSESQEMNLPLTPPKSLQASSPELLNASLTALSMPEPFYLSELKEHVIISVNNKEGKTPSLSNPPKSENTSDPCLAKYRKLSEQPNVPRTHNSGTTLIWINLLRGLLNNSSWIMAWTYLMNISLTNTTQNERA